MNLAFLSPALLGGLAVLAVPLLIHLISKRRARRVRFAALDLLLRSQKRTARSVRLRQILLLLVRTLILAAIALAVARPVLQPEQGVAQTGAPLVVVLAVDVSASMNTVLDGKSMFARAQAAALDVLRSEPTDVRAGAVACDGQSRDLITPTFDRALVVDAVSALQPGWHHADIAACAARAASLARSIEGVGERRVVVLSDLAMHGLRGAQPTASAEGVVLEWRPVIDEEAPPNHAILDVSAARTSGKAGDALEVKLEAIRHGGPATDVTADLVVGERRAARLSLPFDGTRPLERTFHHVLGEEGAGGDRLAVMLGDDALAADNIVVLPFEMPPPLKVLVVDGAPQAVAFKDEIFYLENALTSTRGRGRMAVEIVATDQLKPQNLAGAQVVVLANVPRLDDSVAAALVEHVKAGAGVFMTMGDQVDVEWTNQKLADLLAAPLRGSKGQALLDDASVAEVLSLARFATDHPVLRGIAAGDDLPGLARVRTNTVMLLEPTGDAQRDVLFRFSNGAPALVERAVGEGRSMMLLTSVDRDWSDLAIRPGFLPLMRQIVLWLGGGLEEGGPRLVRVGEVKKIRVPRGADKIEVEGPGGKREVLRVEESAEVQFRNTDRPGLYRVFARQPGGDARERPEERFTVMIAREESDLTRAAPDALASAAPPGAISRSGAQGDNDVPLWPWLLCAAALLVMLEAALVRRHAAVA